MTKVLLMYAKLRLSGSTDGKERSVGRVMCQVWHAMFLRSRSWRMVIVRDVLRHGFTR